LQVKSLVVGTDVCQHLTHSTLNQSYCCCYGDGCNGAIGGLNPVHATHLHPHHNHAGHRFGLREKVGFSIFGTCICVSILLILLYYCNRGRSTDPGRQAKAAEHCSESKETPWEGDMREKLISNMFY